MAEHRHEADQDFNAFLTETVNLNSTRFDLLESSIESIKTAVRGLTWGPVIIVFAAQGSWAHKTIIKPLPGDAFDADLLVFVEPFSGWEAKDYINGLYAALSAGFQPNHSVQASSVKS